MELKQAVNNAHSCIQQAEDAADPEVRVSHLKMARKWLQEADVDEWSQRYDGRTIIIAIDETIIIAIDEHENGSQAALI